MKIFFARYNDVLKCENLVKLYSGCRAVDGLNLELDAGRIYALLGPNGSGKSTFMKMVVGLIKPTEGKIYLDGEEISDKTRARITYMPTENYFYNYMRIKDIASFYKDFYNDFDEDRMYGLLDRMELHFDGKVRNMSTGMLAKLKVAVAMARNSRVILLDEPLNGIDIIAREHVMNTITGYNNEDKIIIVSSHLVDELEHAAGGAVFIKDGRVVMAGNTEDIRSYNDNKSLVDLYKEIYGGMYNGQTY
ncbi:ABC transporter ATP-binding protein [Eshraghiella crossota]|uniref:ABC transporter, ATP-binding protein n=1 Tax=Eshraghiella crossota DSM 2876 TaxID=511680 RepID=D4RX12_9FIRM|nr:ABC transporter ATP-binding protein [Butyrivibrio crossotus]EFF69452.1 ABC transporter, ATP-binding protein [Butyrivibrio crossotus DSM 2876]UWO49972.1 ABC transporter ATP-binding protein [Butyrivibrio crossotus]